MEPELTASEARHRVYVDGPSVGTADLICNVALGQRTIDGDFEVYGAYSWWTEVDGQFYGYGAGATVTLYQLHKTITFVYIWQ